MASYLIRRLAMLPFVALGVTLLLFALLQLLSPEMRAALYIQDPRQLSALESVIETYHLRDPFPVQYWTWLKQVLVGDLDTPRRQECRCPMPSKPSSRPPLNWP